jgi:hypothetical protein
MLFYQIAVFLLNGKLFAALGDQFGKLIVFYQFLDHVQPSNKFALNVQLGISRPVIVVSQPKPHIFVLNDVVVCVLNIMVFKDLQKSCSESAFRIFRSSFNENYDGAAF